MLFVRHEGGASDALNKGAWPAPWHEEKQNQVGSITAVLVIIVSTA